MKKIIRNSKKIWNPNEYNVYMDCLAFYGICNKMVNFQEEYRNDSKSLEGFLLDLAIQSDFSRQLAPFIHDENVLRLLNEIRHLSELMYTHLSSYLENKNQTIYDLIVYIASQYCDLYKDSVVDWKQETTAYSKRISKLLKILLAIVTAELIYLAKDPFISSFIDKVHDYFSTDLDNENSYDFSDIEKNMGVHFINEDSYTEDLSLTLERKL